MVWKIPESTQAINKRSFRGMFGLFVYQESKLAGFVSLSTSEDCAVD